jgi:hypothetical protein
VPPPLVAGRRGRRRGKRAARVAGPRRALSGWLMAAVVSSRVCWSGERAAWRRGKVARCAACVAVLSLGLRTR